MILITTVKATTNVFVFVQLVSTDGSSVSDSKSQGGAGDSVVDMDITTEKRPVQQSQPVNMTAR